MNYPFRHLVLYFALAINTHAPAEGLPQTQRIELIDDKAYLRLDGVPGRTYFFQSSKPGAELEEWLWLPEIRSGTGAELSLEVDRTPSKMFFRVKYTDLPIPEGKTAETADFDGDGLSNLAEVSDHATDPFNTESDGDTLPDAWEVTHGLNPALAGDANSFFPGSDITYTEAFQSGLQNHPNATLEDLDGDGTDNDDDAAPQDLAINWEPSPSSTYAWIPVELPAGYKPNAINNHLDVLGSLLDSDDPEQKFVIKSIDGTESIIAADFPNPPAHDANFLYDLEFTEISGRGWLSDSKDFLISGRAFYDGGVIELGFVQMLYNGQSQKFEFIGNPDSLDIGMHGLYDEDYESENPGSFIGNGYAIAASSNGRILMIAEKTTRYLEHAIFSYNAQSYEKRIDPNLQIVYPNVVVEGGQAMINWYDKATRYFHTSIWDGGEFIPLPYTLGNPTEYFGNDMAHCPNGQLWIIGVNTGWVKQNEETDSWAEAKALKFRFPGASPYSSGKINNIGEVIGQSHIWRNTKINSLVDLCPALEGLEATDLKVIDPNETGAMLAEITTGNGVEAGLLVPSVIEQYDFETEKASDGVFTVTPADPRPEVDMQLAAAEVNASGQLEVRVTGTVRDQLSEVVEGQRISELRFSVNGQQVKAINLNFGAGQAPWTLADSLNTFDETILISDPKPGGYEIRAETDANTAGNTGWDRVATGLTREDDPAAPHQVFNQLSIAFSQNPSAAAADSLTLYFGNRAPAAGDAVFTETASNSLQFTGSLLVEGQATACTLWIKDFTGSVGGVEGKFSAELRYTPAGGQEVSIATSLAETAAGSLRFYPDGFQINAERNTVHAMPDLGGSKGEDIQPLLMKVGLPEALASQEGFRILVNGSPHALKKFSYDGKDGLYVVNTIEDTRPKIFVPCVQPLPAANLLPGCDLPGEAIRWEMEFDEETYLLNSTLVLPGAQNNLAAPTPAARGFSSRSASDGWQQPGDSITFDDLVTAYKFIYTDEISRTLLQVYLQQGHEISLEDVYGNYEFSYHSRPGTKALIKIEHDDNDIHPGICAQYLWRGLTKALTIFSFRKAVAEALNENSLEIDALNAYKAEVGPAAAEVGIAAAELYLSGIGIVNEPADWLLVVNDVAEGNYASLTAALPFISRGLVTVGKGIRIENRAGQVLGRLDAESFPALRDAMLTGKLETVGTVLDQYELSKFIGKLIAKDGSKISAPKRQEGLKKAMKRRVPKPGDLFEAHHDFPWSEREWFARHGVNVNNPAFGRWAHKKDHDIWHKGAGGGEFHQFWYDFMEEEATGPRKTVLDILAALEECRQRFPVTITE